MPRVACVIAVSTPYFRARFAAVPRERPDVELHALEMGRRSETYAFAPETRADGYQRHFLAETPVERQGAGEIRRNLFAALDRIRPAVVGLPGWFGRPAFAAALWCARRGVPALVMSESTAHDEARAAWREGVKRRYLRLCAAALAGGRPHADYLAQLGLSRERIFLGYDAVDNAHFAAGAEAARGRAAQLRQVLDLPERYFLASARFIEKKNLPLLLRAYARYRQLAATAQSGGPASPGWSLVLLGDGPLRPSLLALRAELGLEQCLRMPGFKQYDELPAYYGLAGAFVHASTTEQWGLVVNEAMASGLPVLVSHRCGCAPDLVQEGINGWTFDPADEEQLAQHLLRLAALEPPQLAALGRASREIVAQWGPRRFATGLGQAVDCALRAGPPRVGLVDRGLLRALACR